MTQRKKILMLGDSMTTFSGVGNQSRMIATGLEAEYDIVQLGGAVKHSNYQPQQIAEHIKVYPIDGYGTKNIILNTMATEQPDYLFIFTDPRYWVWLWRFEDEIRTNIPILYYHLWDAFPAPKYNKLYFESTDWVGHINRLSGDIIKELSPKYCEDSWRLKYIPHGIDTNLYTPNNRASSKFKQFDNEAMNNLRDRFDFIVGYNSRNIKRKQLIDVMYGYKLFVQTLEKEQQKKTCLLIHTDQLNSDHGTDLMVVKQDLLNDINVVFSTQRLNPTVMPYIYTMTDVFVNLSSNEGYGLSSAEALMSGVPVITTMTGGLQDQQGLRFDNGDTYLTQNGWLNKVPYTHGEWCIPMPPVSRSLTGSPPTPYIFDDKIDVREYAAALRTFYDMGKEERERRGALGREYLISEGHTQEAMCNRISSSLKDIDANWKPVINRPLVHKIN